jgi:1-acyl-sn-glycerol-3-phosphate acyltransferase
LPALKSGSSAVAANHLGRLDAILIYYLLDRKDIIMLVAEKYRKIPLAPWFVKKLDGIWVDRFNADFNALRQALERMRQGGVLVLAPEGIRSPDGLLEGKPGISYLAAKVGAQIFPVAVVGSEDKRVLTRLSRFQRAPVTVKIGAPFTLPAFQSKDRQATTQKYTDEIMCRIAALLPPEYRGVYADHPRLRELLSHNP